MVKNDNMFLTYWQHCDIKEVDILQWFELEEAGVIERDVREPHGNKERKTQNAK